MSSTPRHSDPLIRLARAQALTLEQLEIARHIAGAKFPELVGDAKGVMTAAIVQALATNYMTEAFAARLDT